MFNDHHQLHQIYSIFHDGQARWRREEGGEGSWKTDQIIRLAGTACGMRVSGQRERERERERLSGKLQSNQASQLVIGQSRITT